MLIQSINNLELDIEEGTSIKAHSKHRLSWYGSCFPWLNLPDFDMPDWILS